MLTIVQKEDKALKKILSKGYKLKFEVDLELTSRILLFQELALSVCDVLPCAGMYVIHIVIRCKSSFLM